MFSGVPFSFPSSIG
uniref:Calreticulin, putative n=1 Tax=Arundo donax TaxID=35708 RepID=A0A0A9FM85_ARUDO